MVVSLLISTCCLVIMSKGVPDWVETILSITYGICNMCAFLSWTFTKEEIKKLERRVDRNERNL